MKYVRVQWRFVKPSECWGKKWERGWGSTEHKKWKKYYEDQRLRAVLDPDLTLNQRKEVVEACEAFEWTSERTVLVREHLG